MANNSERALSDVRKTDSKRISLNQSQSVAKLASHGTPTTRRNAVARMPSRIRRRRGLRAGLMLLLNIHGGDVIEA
jgi:hypothetical protein